MVDTGTTSQEDQRKMMEDYADGNRVKAPPAATGSASTAATAGIGAGGKEGGGGGGGGGGGMSKGFLGGKNGGALYPEGSREGASEEEKKLREMVPSQDELRRIAAETDPQQFMNELSQLGSLLGVDSGLGGGGGGGGGGSLASMLNGLGGGDLPDGVDKDTLERMARHAFADLDISDGGSGSGSGSGGGPHFGSKADAMIDGKRKKQPPAAASTKPAAAPLPAAEATPSYDLAEADGGSSIVLKIQLPEMSGLGDASVDVGPEAFALHAPGMYKLDLTWPHQVSADDAKAKFSKKTKTLTVTAPIVV